MPRARSHMRIGELAAHTGLSIDTVRFYERSGVLPPPARDASGYRRYGQAEVRMLLTVKWAQDLGFSLADIAAVFASNGQSAAARKRLLAELIEQKRAEIRAERARLAKLDVDLATLAAMPFEGECWLPEAFVDVLVKRAAKHEKR